MNDVVGIILLVAIIIVAIFAGLYFLNRWSSRKMVDQNAMIEKNKQTVSIFVIDKKKEKASEVNLPKSVSQNLPKLYRFMKMPFVKAKVGPQILTLMCEKKVYEVLPVKKNVKVELAGIYIVGMKGMKTKKEMEELARSRHGNADAPLKWNQKIAKAVDVRRFLNKDKA
ncbi:MAG: hypothetical protein FWF44_04845 [Defluviitaleaceae bacterium]|nr:hypothetical protein [Defluviitaleaceae bacterium]